MEERSSEKTAATKVCVANVGDIVYRIFQLWTLNILMKQLLQQQEKTLTLSWLVYPRVRNYALRKAKNTNPYKVHMEQFKIKIERLFFDVSYLLHSTDMIGVVFLVSLNLRNDSNYIEILFRENMC